MASTFDTDAFDRGTDTVFQFFTIDQAQRLVEYRGDPTLQSRIEELAGLSKEGELSEQERAEYEGYVRANKFVAILQAKARKYLARASSWWMRRWDEKRSTFST